MREMRELSQSLDLRLTESHFETSIFKMERFGRLITPFFWTRFLDCPLLFVKSLQLPIFQKFLQTYLRTNENRVPSHHHLDETIATTCDITFFLKTQLL